MSKTTALEFNLKTANLLDKKDPLKKFKSEFNFPKITSAQAKKRVGRKPIYMCGNSLGLQPKKTKKYIDEFLQDWANLAVEGHFKAKKAWLPYHEFVTESMAKVVGANASEVVVMNGLTVNLHILLTAFYQPKGTRRKILIEKNAFPSDRYAVCSHLHLHGFSEADLIEVENSTDAVLAAIEKFKSEIALIMLGQVNYLSGYAFNIQKIAHYAHAHEIIFGVDLAHGAGNLELQLHNWNIDFAAWCSYKYLNSGPGGIAGIFVHENHAHREKGPRLAGWWGHNKATRFLMGPNFEPMAGAEGYQISNPPIFQLAALRASLDLFDRATMPKLRKKSVSLTKFLEMGLRLIPRISIITSANEEERGCQLSVRIEGAGKEFLHQLEVRGVFCDFREPNIFRFAPTPLYCSFADVFFLVETLNALLRKKDKV